MFFSLNVTFQKTFCSLSLFWNISSFKRQKKKQAPTDQEAFQQVGCGSCGSGSPQVGCRSCSPQVGCGSCSPQAGCGSCSPQVGCGSCGAVEELEVWKRHCCFEFPSNCALWQAAAALHQSGDRTQNNHPGLEWKLWLPSWDCRWSDFAKHTHSAICSCRVMS